MGWVVNPLKAYVSSQAVAMLTSDTGPTEGHEHGIMLRLGNVYGGKEDIECEVRMSARRVE